MESARDMKDVTAVIVNRKTLNLTRGCVRSLLHIYPGIHIVLVDNKSQDRSTRYIRLAAILCGQIHCTITDHTAHGPGLHAGILCCETHYVLTLDSDVVVLGSGWLERMLGRFARGPDLFAVGNISLVDSSGVRPGEQRIVAPFCALWDREKYLALDVRFEASGQPARGVCFEAVAAGYRLDEFVDIKAHGVGKYVHHIGGGTRVALASLARSR